ncbi:MAG: PD-(D/E)XK nuclease family protein [Terracidiphilus sp.]
MTTTSIQNIPTLRQSSYEKMACPHSYAAQEIEGKRMPSGLQSQRGTEIHTVMSRYIDHCVKRQVPADWAKFDELAAGAGPEASTILEGLRDNYAVDWEHVYGTELTMGINIAGNEGDEDDTTGTLDVLLFLNEQKAKIEDFKSHPRPFDPDTFQSKVYALFVLLLFPSVQEVAFELIFVRYANCRRSATFTRADVPMLAMQVRHGRERQLRIHEQHDAGEILESYPGNHCCYCPLLQTAQACPIADFNPHATMQLVDRLKFAIWAQQVKKVNDDVMKAYVDATGEPIETRDANGRLYQIGVVSSESAQYPLPMVLEALTDWEHASGEDLKPKLLVSSTKLKQFAKAKKRVVLDQYLHDHAETISKPKFKISTPAETDNGEINEREEWEA